MPVHAYYAKNMQTLIDQPKPASYIVTIAIITIKCLCVATTEILIVT